ncbi:MAG: type I 3-dehydroquinate dehydratase [Lachnospiraceae bacterium]|nr:type I 3-dehydroquinate dehydratase [Lachnospiraceae bacterium]
MPIFIKGIHVDTAKPIVCVPITERTAEDIFDAAGTLIDEGVRMLEWRVDCFGEHTDPQAVREVLDTLQGMTKNVILLVTVRTVAQGGSAELDEAGLVDIYDRIAQAHAADIIDVEAFSFADPTAIIRGLHLRGALVLLSHHDFARTPDIVEMEQIFEKMASLDGDIVKLAVMPQTASDAFLLMAAAAEFHEKNHHVPLVAIAMGKEGALTRIAGGLFGSCITFAAGSEPSAPGQLPFAEAEAGLDFMERYAR